MDLANMNNELDFLKADLWQQWQELATDQKKRIPAPPLEKPASPNARRIDLVPPENFTVGELSVRTAIERRRSRREYTAEPLNLEEISYLLWATQGVREIYRDLHTRRTVPSA